MTQHNKSIGSRRASVLAVLGLFAAGAGASMQTIDPAAGFPEGPLWKDGRLLYVDYGGNTIREWNGETLRTVWTHAQCGPSGLIAWRGGHLLVACYDSNSLIELDQAYREVHTFDRDRRSRVFHGPNDFAADGKGGVYFSASGNRDAKGTIDGAVLYLSSAGVISEVATHIRHTNGLTLSMSGKSLLVADTLSAEILEMQILQVGSLGAPARWTRLAKLAAAKEPTAADAGPDGLKLGPDGNYYIAQNGAGRVLVVSPAKKLLRSIDVPTPFVTNIAFGADGAQTLFITGVFNTQHLPYRGAVYKIF